VVAITSTEPANKTKPVPLRWTYILLPAAILLLSIILAAGLYPQLPAEVAYRFADGTPDGWLSRAAFTTWAIALQLALSLLSLVVVSVAALAVRQLPESALTRRLLAVMGNIVVLPQLIIAFAMLDIFLYNIYQIQLLPIWVFALMVMVLGGTILAVFFIQAIRQVSGQPGKSPQE